MRKLVLLLLLLVASAAALGRQANADYRARRVALSLKTKGGLVVLFARTEAEDIEPYAFHQDQNFYYLTGLVTPGAALVIAPQAEAKGETPARPYTEILFLPQHNRLREKWTGAKLGPDDPDIAKTTGFDRVEALDRMRDELARLLPPQRITVYSDLPEFGDRSTATAPLEWLKRANALPAAKFEDVKPLLAALRMIKDAGELALIRKAVDASVAAHLAAMHTAKPGMNEHDIAVLMRYEFERRGCERAAYPPIVGAGINSTILHYEADDAPIKDGDVLLLDVAGEYSYYASDITRTLPANGKFTPRQRELYDIVLGAQEAAIKAFQAGRSLMYGEGPESLTEVAREYVNTHGKDLHGQPLGKYFLHGLGHFVGLDVHDPGVYTAPLDKDMVFTMEPGIYIPEEKTGIRIEDMFYVDQDGKLVRLTAALPLTADQVEKAMAGR